MTIDKLIVKCHVFNYSGADIVSIDAFNSYSGFHVGVAFIKVGIY